MACISSVSFSILLNCKLGSSFSLSCGLRQGYTLSQYLLLIICEALIENLRKLVNNGVIKGIKLGRNGPILSHLFFVDDALFFSSRRSNQIVYNLRSSFKIIIMLLGKRLISTNLSLFQLWQTCICYVFYIKGVDDPEVYLGLPTIWRRSKKLALGYIKERMKKKVQGCAKKLTVTLRDFGGLIKIRILVCIGSSGMFWVKVWWKEVWAFVTYRIST